MKRVIRQDDWQYWKACTNIERLDWLMHSLSLSKTRLGRYICNKVYEQYR